MAKLKGEGRIFWNGKAHTYSINCLTCGGNVNYYKNVHHPIPFHGNREKNYNNPNSLLLFIRPLYK